MLDSSSSSISAHASASVDKYVKDAEDEAMTNIPQAYWDDLFDSALATLNAIPLSSDLYASLDLPIFCGS
jgi:hypothetical protein